MRVLILSTPTKHHTYFINKVAEHRMKYDDTHDAPKKAVR